MAKLKIKNRFIFGIAIWIFSILVQGSLTARFPQSCSKIQLEAGSNSSGLQNCLIYPNGPEGTSLEVRCDFETDGGGWTLIQKRSSGSKIEFQGNWTLYANGFGSLDNNFWVGLDNIHAFTKDGDQELRIEMEDFEGEKRWAKYSNFSISEASDFYRLAISGYSENSTARDSMTYFEPNDGMGFTTTDKDNDNWAPVNCALEYGGGGGWWFHSCGLSNLNGMYHQKGEAVQFQQGIYWEEWKGNYYSLAKTEMKIRTRKS